MGVAAASASSVQPNAPTIASILQSNPKASTGTELPSARSARVIDCTIGMAVCTPSVASTLATVESSMPPRDVDPITRSGVGPDNARPASSTEVWRLVMMTTTETVNDTPAPTTIAATRARSGCNRSRRSASKRIARSTRLHQLSVVQRLTSARPPRRLGVVRHHQQRDAALADLLGEKRQHRLAVRRVEVARRLIGKEECRLRDEGASDGGTLQLTTGQLGGQVLHAVGEADALEQLRGAAVAARAVEEQGQLDVLAHGERGDEV